MAAPPLPPPAPLDAPPVPTEAPPVPVAIDPPEAVLVVVPPVSPGRPPLPLLLPPLSALHADNQAIAATRLTRDVQRAWVVMTTSDCGQYS
jgi:hypothetical protein